MSDGSDFIDEGKSGVRGLTTAVLNQEKFEFPRKFSEVSERLAFSYLNVSKQGFKEPFRNSKKGDLHFGHSN
jgi:hypothetical protein